MRRRFFEGFQQGVKRRRRKHVHFIDDVDFITALSGGVLAVLSQFSYLINAIIGGSIDLNNIHTGTIHDRLTDIGIVVGLDTWATLCIE